MAERNTLYVTTQGAYVGKDHETVQVRNQGETMLTVPLHHLGAIICLGRVSVSPDLMGECAERDIEIAFLTEQGRFRARVEGSGAGRAALRRSQYRIADDPKRCLGIARAVVIGKIANSRTTLLRVAREHEDAEARQALTHAAERMHNRFGGAERAETLDALRGEEGEGAATYFGVFDRMIRKQRDAFRFNGRSRRPPRDAVNAMLSFLYAMVVADASSAVAAVGLDPAVGFLHAERPGRPSLALDLAEEFRPFLADRTALALINLGQVSRAGFTTRETGGVEMDDATRRTVIVAYQERKAEAIKHPFTEEESTVGMLFLVQARLLARAIRADLDGYPPFHSR